jgi:hypothetical protein
MNESVVEGGTYGCQNFDFVGGSGWTSHIRIYPARTSGKMSQVLTPLESMALVAGMPVAVQLLTFDEFQNSREVGGDQFDVGITSALRPEQPIQYWILDHGYSNYTLIFVPSLAARYVLDIRVAYTHSLLGGDNVVRSWTSLPPTFVLALGLRDGSFSCVR